MIGGVLCVHLTIFILILTHLGTWRLSWFLGMIIELPILNLAKNRL